MQTGLKIGHPEAQCLSSPFLFKYNFGGILQFSDTSKCHQQLMPSGKLTKAIENGHVWSMYLVIMVIFQSDGSSPGGQMSTAALPGSHRCVSAFAVAAAR